VTGRALKTASSRQLISGKEFFGCRQRGMLGVDVLKEFLSGGIGRVGDAIFCDKVLNESLAFGGGVAEPRHLNEQPWKSPFTTTGDGFGENIVPESVADGGEFGWNQGLGLAAQIFPLRFEACGDAGETFSAIAIVTGETGAAFQQQPSEFVCGWLWQWLCEG